MRDYIPHTAAGFPHSEMWCSHQLLLGLKIRVGTKLKILAPVTKIKAHNGFPVHQVRPFPTQGKRQPLAHRHRIHSEIGGAFFGQILLQRYRVRVATF